MSAASCPIPVPDAWSAATKRAGESLSLEEGYLVGWEEVISEELPSLELDVMTTGWANARCLSWKRGVSFILSLSLLFTQSLQTCLSTTA